MKPTNLSGVTPRGFGHERNAKRAAPADDACDRSFFGVIMPQKPLAVDL